MALTYDYRKCNDSNWTERDKEIAGQFCWSLMSIGMQNVTEKNKDEIIFRFMFLQNIGQCVFVKGQTLERYIEIVNKLIGYETNVGNETRSSWIKRRIKHFVVALQNTIDSELRENQRLDSTAKTKIDAVTLR
jgi:hypothetical protein